MIHSFLLIGQSNMAGRGRLEEAVPVDTKHIYVLRNGRWQPMFRPINPDRSFSGVNLAERFAECYAQAYGVDVGLIPCADGGTKLDQWQPGGELFDHAIFQAKLAKRTSKLAGILWHQGESDSQAQLHQTYAARLTEMMVALRQELDAQDLPFLIGGLGDFLKDCTAFDMTEYAHINHTLQQVSESQPNTVFVSATGLRSHADNLHFDAKSLYEFGERYFDALEELAPAVSTVTSVESSDLERTALEQL